ncbi:hypothetical protein [Lentzea aerocolonigenes]|uniref:hypothetical protein n=1 Tax=Lentzea aerocolonigenes TaxID=68170 RepID=UPI000562DA70|nr:hypothetical protein [Lentzea aerocolonigenes]MCP2242183.1 hypothetical protein [Lentzea aerocolonigenes]
MLDLTDHEARRRKSERLRLRMPSAAGRIARHSRQVRLRPVRRSQVPLAMTSKTPRLSTLSTATEINGRLLRHAAFDAVKAIETALKEAEAAWRDHFATTIRQRRRQQI